MKNSINVTLISESTVSPTILSSHAAKTCYEPEMPEIGKTIDVKSRLFDTGHHTTLQHNFLTFAIDGISVSSVCFGLHLAAPFYNTDQRSGRFSKMYDEPNISEIEEHVKNYFPNQNTKSVIDFIRKGLEIYSKNKEKVTKIAAEQIKLERPFVSEKYISSNAPKFAQEQLRMFISMVAPTALEYTINISTLAAFYRTAWTPEMRDVIGKMVRIVTDKYPDISYMFDESVKSNENWSPEYKNNKFFGIFNLKPKLKSSPELKVLGVKYDPKTINTNDNVKDMVDTFYFLPKCMNNTQNFVSTDVEISCATMGQDQRHRTIKRSEPVFTGNFYLPPLLKLAGLEKQAIEFMNEFNSMLSNGKFDQNLVTMIAPYGTMVRYTKNSDLNALMHEQGKRTCWCAQEEIYHLGTKLRRQLVSKLGEKSELVKKTSPHCYANGKCCEGVRYCGRDIKARLTRYYFKNRQI